MGRGIAKIALHSANNRLIAAVIDGKGIADTASSAGAIAFLRCAMHSHPKQSIVLAAFAATFLVASVVPAAPQSNTPPGGANAAASQTALAIAGVAAMKPAIAGFPPAQPAEAGPAGTAIVAPASAAGAEPARPAAQAMTAEQRRQFMLLLMLRNTSRNPFGVLH
jgi:hypothetical protein